MPSRALARLRRLCLALPAAHEVEAWGEPTFRVNNKLFAMHASPGNHHGGGRSAVWLKAAPGNQPLMVRAAPDRFFVPPYVGPSGWIGVWIDAVGAPVDWDELALLLADAHRLVAPKRLLAQVARDAEAATAARAGSSARTTARTRPIATRAPVKKAPARKAPAKKAPVKKAPVKKAPAKKAPAKKTATRPRPRGTR